MARFFLMKATVASHVSNVFSAYASASLGDEQVFVLFSENSPFRSLYSINALERRGWTEALNSRMLSSLWGAKELPRKDIVRVVLSRQQREILDVICVKLGQSESETLRAAFMEYARSLSLISEKVHGNLRSSS